MSNLAQEEFDRYLPRAFDHLNCHPEDASRSDTESESDNDRTTTRTAVQSDPDDDDDDETLHNMATMATTRTAYHLPSTLFDANTGPKGVIADAQSFERAKKKSFRRTLIDLTNGAYNTITLGSKSNNSLQPQKENLSSSLSSSGSSDGEDEEEFMRLWRQKRIQEMNAGAVRRQSPSKRKYGSLDAVDAEGFLDAVEKVPEETVVVVCIYDPESNASAALEEPLAYLARKYPTTRFVKLHHEIAEMEHIGVPAILAYRGGEVFSTLMDIKTDGVDGGVGGVERLLKRERVLS